LAGRFRVVTYKSLVGGTAEVEAQPGTYIFSDIDRLTPMGAELAARAWKTFSDLGADARILNHPTRSMRRYELLRTLFERGDNTFDVYRLVECRRPQRWPVFIREENAHTKNLTPLLHSPEELEAAAAEIFARGESRENKLVVEFRDTHDDRGLFYKYAAFLIGERVIPSALIASRDWMITAERPISTPEVVEKEHRYMNTNPHERELRAIFRLARIDYGRVDYSMLGNRLQVWEINTNPNITNPSNRPDDAERKDVMRMRADRIAAAFAEIDVQDDTREPGPRATVGL
jgi:hypothetical protein